MTEHPMAQYKASRWRPMLFAYRRLAKAKIERLEREVEFYRANDQRLELQRENYALRRAIRELENAPRGRMRRWMGKR